MLDDRIVAPGRGEIVRADIRDRYRFGDCEIDCWITSPPYWAQRAYGDDEREIGRPEQPLSAYLSDMLAAARTLFAMTSDDGVGWLNMGDTNAGSGGAGGDYNAGGRKAGQTRYRQGDPGVDPGQLCLVPFHVAERFREAGWMIRQVITWVKTVKAVPTGEEHGRNRLRPEDPRHVRRPLFTTELIFMLTKSAAGQHRYCQRPDEEQGNAWHFPPSRGNGHGAPFPDELVRRCLAHTFADDERHAGHIVFDPFSGSSTTISVALALGFNAWGTDLYLPTDPAQPLSPVVPQTQDDVLQDAEPETPGPGS